MKHVLVVANQTLGGKDLLDAVAARMREGPCQFTLLVPEAHRDNMRSLNEMAIGAPVGFLDDGSRAEAAHRRLAQGLEEFRARGATVDGFVGPEDPVRAVHDLLKHRRFDEIILSTLPKRVSRWLGVDLPSKVAGLGLPVTTVTAKEVQRQDAEV